jgi:hypothetical protein
VSTIYFIVTIFHRKVSQKLIKIDSWASKIALFNSGPHEIGEQELSLKNP